MAKIAATAGPSTGSGPVAGGKKKINVSVLTDDAQCGVTGEDRRDRRFEAKPAASGTAGLTTKATGAEAI